MNCPATSWSVTSDAIDHFSIYNRQMTTKHKLTLSENIELTRSSLDSVSTHNVSRRQRWRIIWNKDWRKSHACGERVGFVLWFGIHIAGVPSHPQCRTPAIGLFFDSSQVNFTWNVHSSKCSYWPLHT
jgi:hypothetical protein